jgi:hypothetical protein
MGMFLTSLSSDRLDKKAHRGFHPPPSTSIVLMEKVKWFQNDYGRHPFSLIIVYNFHQVVLVQTVGMTPLSKTSHAILLDSHLPLESLDGDGDNRSGHESMSKDQGSSSNNESDSNSRSGSSRTGNTDEDINLIKDGLAREETKNVFRLRILVILILVVTAIAMSFTIYHITHQAEIDEFDSEFEGVADTIIASLNGT